MRRVVDASALLDALLPTERQGAALRGLIGHELWAPSILDLEVTSALWRLLRTSAIDQDEAEAALEGLRSAPIRRLDHTALAGLAWELRQSLRISDAFYVAAATMLDADLLTSDARLSRAPAPGVTMVVLG